MKKKTIRIDVSGQEPPLSFNPFSKLSRQGSTESGVESEVPSIPCTNRSEEKTLDFSIQRTKKGGYPISVERRASGKMVTVVRNVTGDAGALCAMLKKHCAAGGTVVGDSVEIQGKHLDAIEALLKERGY